MIQGMLAPGVATLHVCSIKMQMEIALSTTEAKYIAFTTTLRECIPLMQLLKELTVNGFHFQATK